jgi:hypothetical protein
MEKQSGRRVRALKRGEAVRSVMGKVKVRERKSHPMPGSRISRRTHNTWW